MQSAVAAFSMAEANVSSKSDPDLLIKGILCKRQRGRSITVAVEERRMRLKFEDRYCKLTRKGFSYYKHGKVRYGKTYTAVNHEVRLCYADTILCREREFFRLKR